MLPDPFSSLFDDSNRDGSSGANAGDDIVLGQTMETLERRNQELQLLHELATRLNKSIETKAAMEVGLDLIIKLTGAESIAILLINAEEGHFDLIAQQGIAPELADYYTVTRFNRAVYEANKINPETTVNLIEYMILTRRIMTTGDFQANPRFNLKPIFDAGYQSLIAFPIHFDAHVFGLAMLGSRQPDHFDQHTVQLGENISAQLGSTLRNHALVTNLTRRVEQIEALVETGTLLQYAPRAYSILPQVLRVICKTLHVRNAAVFLINGDNFDVVGTVEPLVVRSRPIVAHHRRMMVSEKPLCVDDREAPDTDPVQREAMIHGGIRSAMGIRLYAREHAFGLLFVNRPDTHVWQPDEQQLITAFAHQIAHALENRRLLEGSHKQVRELKSLARVGRLIATANPPDVALYSVADEIARVFAVDYVGFHLREGEYMRLVAESSTTGAAEFLPIQPYQYRILAELDPTVVSDSEKDAVNPQQHEFLRVYGIRADLGIPLVSEHKAVGILYLSHHSPRVWSEEDIELADTFAHQIAGALANARLVRDSESRVYTMRALALNANLIAHSRSPEAALPQVASDLRRLLSADYVGFHLVDGNDLRVVTEAHQPLANLRYPIQPYHKLMLDYAQVHIIAERDRDARDESYRRVLAQYGFHASIVVPLVARGKTIGILCVNQKKPRLWRETEIQLVQTYAQQTATVLENVQLLNEKEQRVNNLEQLTELNEISVTGLSEDSLIELSMGVLRQLLNADRVTLTTMENGVLKPSRSSDGKVHPQQPMRPSKELDELLSRKQPVIVDPLHPPQILGDFVDRVRFHQTKSYMTVPLMSVNETLGIIGFMYHTDHVFSDAEIRLAKAAANQLAMAIANARLLRDQKTRIEKLSQLSEFGLWCGTLRNSTKLIKQAVDRVAILLDARAASIRLLNGDTLSVGACVGYRNPAARDHTITVSPNLHHILYQQKPYPIRDLAEEPGLPAHWRERQMQEGFRALLMVPMRADTQVIGILTLFHHQVKAWDASEIQFVQTVANTLALAFANVRQMENARDNSDELRATLDSVFSGVFTTDPEGRILTWNNAAQKITGFSVQEMHGKMWHLHGPRAGTQRRDDMIVFEAMAENTACFSLAPRFFTCADGHVIELREAAAALRDGNGLVRGAVCAFWDRTQEQAAERAKVDFINLVAHQLNNKLSVLIWSAEQMQRDDLSPKFRQDLFKIISKTLTELQVFNARFIEFQAEHSHHEIEESEVNLKLFVHAKAKVWRSTHPTRKFRVGGDLSPVLADEMRLDVVIDNLLDNACKYSPANSAITLRGTRIQADMLELSIHNSGTPIDPELLPRLFDRFERGESNKPGTGLGLWLVRTKLHEMGGDIHVTNPPRGGTTFHLILRTKPARRFAVDKADTRTD